MRQVRVSSETKTYIRPYAHCDCKQVGMALSALDLVKNFVNVHVPGIKDNLCAYVQSVLPAD